MAEGLAAPTTQQAPLPNGAVPPDTAAPKPAEPLSPKLAAIMKREADAVRRIREAKTAQEQLKNERMALQAEKLKIEEFNKLWKENPVRAVKGLGVDPMQLALSQDGRVTPEMQLQMLQQELVSLRGELNSRDEKQRETFEQASKREEEELVQSFQGDIDAFLAQSTDKFPLTSLYKRGDLVYSLIEQEHAKSGVILDIDKASEQIEAKLGAEFKRGREILDKREAAKAPPPTEARSRYQAPPTQEWAEKPIKTIAGISQSATPPRPIGRVLSDEERIDRAIAKLRAAKR